MDQRKTTLERAFELASSGRCFTVTDIALMLRAEKHDLTQLEGAQLKKQLAALIEEAIKQKPH